MMHDLKTLFICSQRHEDFSPAKKKESHPKPSGVQNDLIDGGIQILISRDAKGYDIRRYKNEGIVNAHLGRTPCMS